MTSCGIIFDLRGTKLNTMKTLTLLSCLFLSIASFAQNGRVGSRLAIIGDVYTMKEFKEAKAAKKLPLQYQISDSLETDSAKIVFSGDGSFAYHLVMQITVPNSHVSYISIPMVQSHDPAFSDQIKETFTHEGRNGRWEFAFTLNHEQRSWGWDRNLIHGPMEEGTTITYTFTSGDQGRTWDIMKRTEKVDTPESKEIKPKNKSYGNQH